LEYRDEYLESRDGGDIAEFKQQEADRRWQTAK
jgi:hypothetical protein